MQKILKGLALGFLAGVLFLVAANARVSAFENSSNSFGKSLGDSRKLASSEAVTNKATRASEFTQNACEVHRKVINLRQKNIIAHAERTQNRLGNLTNAVIKYYTEKLIPQGKIVANYNSLVSDVTAKHALLTEALDKIKADTQGLTCEKNQAKTQFTTFRTDMQTLLKTFKDYRLSVLRLMQAVKKTAGTTEAGEASGSAKELSR